TDMSIQYYVIVILFMISCPPFATLFPYTTLFRSIERPDGAVRHALVLGSRTHLYEGRGIRRVAHGVRTAAAAGCETVILTNGCRSEEHTSELQSRENLVCRLLLEKKK